MVRFKGENKNEIIDWETAKNYSTDVMEFFGSRTIWTDMNHIMDPELDVHEDEDATNEESVPSTSQQIEDCPPNEIEYEK